jgi:predicted dehydrogenase
MQNDSQKSLIKTAIVGLDGHGVTITNAAVNTGRYDIRAVFDVNEKLMSEKAVELGCDTASSYEALMARDDLEAVVLVTPNTLHRWQTELAIDRGLDIFIEKPIANTVRDGAAMIEAAARAGRKLIVGHNMRFSRTTPVVRRLIESGELGEVVTVEIHYSADNTQRMSHDAWRFNPDECPLLPVMQLGIHGIDVIQHVVAPLDEVFAYSNSVTVRPEVVDSLVAAVTFENGARGTIVSNYCTQVAFQYLIAGTKGSVFFTPHRLWFRHAVDTNSQGEGPFAEEHNFLDRPQENYTLQMDAVADGLQTGRFAGASAEEALRALAVVEALQMSAERRKPIRIEEILSLASS